MASTNETKRTELQSAVDDLLHSLLPAMALIAGVAAASRSDTAVAFVERTRVELAEKAQRVSDAMKAEG